MTIWNSYPDHYRKSEIQSILRAVGCGECASIVGLSGAGKSNLFVFLANRVSQGQSFYFIDCNDLTVADFQSLLAAMVHALKPDEVEPATLSVLTSTLEKKLIENPKKICLLFDRFDLFQLAASTGKIVFNNLRALRDRFKYDLTYVISSRRPLDPASELSELFYAHTIWLGPLSSEDAAWSIDQYAKRHELTWNNEIVQQIYNISLGYPSMVRAVCEAYASGVQLTIEAMRGAPPVQFRVKEFWSDSPTEIALVNSHLEHHPLLMEQGKLTTDNNELTALEQRLLDYLSSRTEQICSKEDLILAVWPEEKLIAGMRDDSLTQLVHRLREKIDPAATNKIQTLPGRGYRFHG